MTHSRKTSTLSRPHVRQLADSCDFFRALGYDCKLGRGKLTILAPLNHAEEQRRREAEKAKEAPCAS